MSIEKKYPEAFLNRMKSFLGNEFNAFLNSLNETPPVSIRFNPFKSAAPSFGEVEEGDIPWCLNGKYLKARPSFIFDPLFHAGTYYVQEASSMFIEEVWKQINPENKTVRVLDMCAAPGGKSTHLLSLMNAASLLVTNEIIPNRNKILRENITKWGTANCFVTQNEPRYFSKLDNYFDIVLVDAPCSGEGLFRKDENAIDEWSEKNVAICAMRQKEILKHAVACLKPNGFLMYSTCTFEEAENDGQIADCGLPVVDFAFENFGQIKTKYGYQFLPHKLKGEGFYISVLQKNDVQNTEANNSQFVIRNSQFHSVVEKYLNHSDDFVPYEKREMLFAIPKNLWNDFQLLNTVLPLRQSGIYLGEIKGKDFLPSHDLALSIHVSSSLPSIELNYDEAIAYLRCDPLKLKTDLRGWCLVKYQSKNIGWIKILENRINNYYPRDWRILKQK